MKLVKTAFVLALAAFWALVTSHCGLENTFGLEFLTCSTKAADSTPHPSSDCGDDDACATIESGYYKSDEKQVSVLKPDLVPLALTLALLSEPATDEFAPGLAPPETAPPELAQAWQFSFRTALPPRAPSLLS